MTTATQNTNKTMWGFIGLFFGGDVDKAGTPIGDIITGAFIADADEATATAAITARYADLSGEFRLTKLTDHRAHLLGQDANDRTKWNEGQHATFVAKLEKDIARIIKRGGTKDVPVLN